MSTTPRKLRSGRCVISTRNSVYVCTISSLLGIKYYTIINLARVWYDGLSPRERLCHLSSGFCPILLSHCQNYKIFVWKMHSLCQTGKHACQKCFMVLYSSKGNLLCLPFERSETYCFSLIFSSTSAFPSAFASSASSQQSLSGP